jgi:hypothetical protein
MNINAKLMIYLAISVGAVSACENPRARAAFQIASPPEMPQVVAVRGLGDKRQLEARRAQARVDAEMDAAKESGDSKKVIAVVNRWPSDWFMKHDTAEWLLDHGAKKEGADMLEEVALSDQVSYSDHGAAMTVRLLGIISEPGRRKRLLDKFAERVRQNDANWVAHGHRSSPIDDMGPEAYLDSMSAGTLEAQGKPIEALKHVDHMIALAPHSLAALKRGAELKWMHGMYGEAKVLAGRAYRMMPAGRERDLYANLYMIPMADREGPQP